MLVHASSLSWGGGVGAQWSRREYLRKARSERGGSAQRSGRGSERARWLGVRGELGGAETLGAEGAWSPGCVQCTRMRGAVGVGEAAVRECRAQRSRAIEHSRVTVERGVKHSRALEESVRVTARAFACVSPRTRV